MPTKWMSLMLLCWLLQPTTIRSATWSETDSLALIDEWDAKFNTYMTRHEWKPAQKLGKRLLSCSQLPARTRLRVLTNMGICLRESGDYPSAISNLTEAVEMCRTSKRLNADGALFSLSGAYIYTGNYGKALECLDRISTGGRDQEYALNRANAMFRRGEGHDKQQALAIVDSVLAHADNTLYSYTTALVNRGYMLWDMGRHDEAAAALAQALGRMEQNDDRRNQTLGNLAVVESELGRHDEALRHIDAVLRWTRDNLGELHNDYVIALRKRAEIMLRKGGNKQALTPYKRYYEAERGLIIRQLPLYDEQRRLDFWMMKKRLVEEVFLLHDTDPELLLDAALLRRQMALLRHGEKDIAAALAVRGQDVRHALHADEAAVEFVCFHDDGENDTVYAALVSARGKTRYVRIATQTELRRHKVSRLRTLEQAMTSSGQPTQADRCRIFADSTLGDMVWKPVMDALPHKPRTIFFAPDGMMHILAVEYLPSHHTEDVERRRLTSTARLLQRGTRRDKGASSMLVVGALDYDHMPAPVDDESRDHAATDYLKQNSPGGNWVFRHLAASHTELEDISRIMGADTASMQTEEQARLNLLHYQRLHFSTHGYALCVQLSRPPAAMRDSMMADNSLLASGLALTGANKAYAKDNIEDGVLSARELSELDLSGVHFVALSACQTALGTPSDEGPAGLLRGLKKAGVGTVLASLWEVHDEATFMLMRAFYDNVAAGKTYHEALRLAQQSLRDSEEYSVPYYWASFILVDDLE